MSARFPLWRRKGAARRRRQSAPLIGLLPVILILGAWEHFGDPNSLTSPPPSRWWHALKGTYNEGLLMPAFWQTVITFAIGLVVTTILGVVIGLAIGASPRLSRALSPLFEYLRTMPPAAIVPVAVLIVGVSRFMSVSIIVFGAIWPVMLNTAAARRALPQIRVDVATSLHLSSVNRMWKVVLPSTVPGIAVGLRVAAPLCLILTLLVEVLNTSGGLGSVMINYQSALEPSGAFGLLIVIGALGYATLLLVNAGENYLLRRWPDSAF